MRAMMENFKVTEEEAYESMRLFQPHNATIMHRGKKIFYKDIDAVFDITHEEDDEQ